MSTRSTSRKARRAATIRIFFDEGNGELILAEGFDDKSPSGRIATRVLDKVYCEALNKIAARGGHRPSEFGARDAFCISV